MRKGGLALAALLLLGPVLTTADAAGPPRLAVGSRTVVSVPGSATSEFAVAQRIPGSPVMATAAMAFTGPQFSDLECRAYGSADAGRSWREMHPFPSEGAYDPWIAYDARGGLHAVCVNRDDFHTRYAYSPDGGRSWRPAIDVPSAGSGSNDKSIVHVTSRGSVLVCRTTFPDMGSSIHSDLAVTADQGRTWRNRPLPGPGYVLCLQMAESGGRLYLLGLQAAGGFIDVVLLTSMDEARTWSTRRIARLGKTVAPDGDAVAYYRQVVEANAARHVIPQLPSLAVHDQQVAVAWSRQLNDGHWQAQLATSADGARFVPRTLPRPASASCSAQAGGMQFSPIVALAPTGELGMRFTCKTDTQLETAGREIWFTASRDSGLRWSAPLLLSRADPREGNVAPQGLASSPLTLAGGTTEGGHYASVASGSHSFLPGWIDYVDGYPRLVVRRVELR